MAVHKPSSVIQIILLVYCVINVLVGLGMVACGAWFHASVEVHAYLTVFVTGAHDSTLVAIAAVMLVTGIILTLISALAIVGLLLNKPLFIFIHLWLQLAVLVVGLVCGFIATGFYWTIHYYVKEGMLGQLQQHYDNGDSSVGRAWNTVQVKKRCCGVDGSWDYEMSDWYHKQNPMDEEVKFHVPRSCCALNFNQDRELFWVDAEEIQLKDETKCQEDAQGRIDNSANLNRLGCFTALLQVNDDLWHDVSIFTVISVFQGLCLGSGFLQIFGMIIDSVYLKERRYRYQEEKTHRFADRPF